MNTKHLLKLLLLFTGILAILTTCPAYPSIPTTSIPKTNPLVLTSASKGMKEAISSSRQLSITITGEIDQECPAGSVWNLFTLTITPPGDTEKEIVRIYIECDTLFIYFGGMVNAPVNYFSPMFIGSAKALNAFVTVDLVKNRVWIEANSKDLFYSRSTNWYGAQSWTFDETTKIYLCSGKDGASSAVDCTISRLQLFSGFTSVHGNLGGFTPITKAFYPLNGELLSTISSAPAGYFGDSPLSPTVGSSPSWDSSNSFVKISSRNQFLTFPLSTITQDPVLMTTPTVSMWVRVSSVPTSTATIFSLLFADGTPAYTVSIPQSTLTFEVSFRGTKLWISHFLPIVFNTWQQITFSLYVPQTSTDARASLFVDDTSAMTYGSAPAGGYLSFTDLRIGDPTNSFIGDVSAVKILSPGIGNVTTTDLCEPDSGLQIGFGPYSLSCPSNVHFNPYDNKCYSSCPVDPVTLFSGAPLSLCLYEPEPENKITTEESGSGGLSTGAMIGIAVGSLVGLGFIALGGYLMKKRSAKSFVRIDVNEKPEKSEVKRRIKSSSVVPELSSLASLTEIRLK